MVNSTNRHSATRNVGPVEIGLAALVVAIFLTPFIANFAWPGSDVVRILFYNYHLFLFYVVAFGLLWVIARQVDKHRDPGHK